MNDTKTAEKLAKIYKALSNSRRVKILFILNKEELTITEIARELHLGLSRISEYVSEMERAGLVKKVREDNKVIVKSLVKINEKGEIKVKG